MGGERSTGLAVGVPEVERQEVERRREPRVELGLPVEVIAGTAPPVPGRICNVSRSGVLVATGVAITVRRLVRLAFTVRDRECAARGAVVRLAAPTAESSQPSGPPPVRSGDTIAIEFLEMNDEMRDFLEATTSLRPELVGDFLASVMTPRITIS